MFLVRLVRTERPHNTRTVDIMALNTSQLDAVETEESCFVRAGPGSGKTKVLVHRVARLVEKGARPSSVLCVTFTNRAADEMRERLKKLLDEESANGVIMCTLHSLATKILRRNPVETEKTVGFRKNFGILDQRDTVVAARTVLASMKEDSSAKAAKLFIKEGGTKDHVFRSHLRDINAIDFDNLLWAATVVVEKSDVIRASLERSVRHLLVDEVQDTDKTQFVLLEHLARLSKKGDPSSSLFAVGDLDQSIYGWRGACGATGIKKLREEFPLKDFYLVENYRSLPPIVECATNLIRHDSSRDEVPDPIPKREGTKDQSVVRYAQYDSSYAETDTIALSVGAVPDTETTAILLRSRKAMTPYRALLTKLNVSHRVIGDNLAFFDRVEIKTIVNYLHFVTNPLNLNALRACINVPPRRLGEKTLAKLETSAGTDLRRVVAAFSESEVLQASFDATEVQKAKQNLSSLGISSLRSIADIARTLGAATTLVSRGEDAKKVLMFLVAHTKLHEYYEDEPERIDNLQVLYEIGSGISSLDLLDRARLDAESKKDPETVRVTISTYHGAKGGEWDHVFVPGIAYSEFGQSDEERRALYVAFTRARNRLYVSCARKSFKNGEMVDTFPSPYLHEAGLFAFDESRQESRILNKKRKMEEII